MSTNPLGSSVNQFSSSVGGILPSDPVINIGDLAGVALTLTPSQSGTTFAIPAQTVNVVINLPAVVNAKGVKYRFSCTATTGFTVSLTATAANLIKGCLLSKLDAFTVQAYAAQTAVVITAAAVAGTWVELTCDGTFWYPSGMPGSAAAAAMFA